MGVWGIGGYNGGAARADGVAAEAGWGAGGEVAEVEVD